MNLVSRIAFVSGKPKELNTNTSNRGFVVTRRPPPPSPRQMLIEAIADKEREFDTINSELGALRRALESYDRSISHAPHAPLRKAGPNPHKFVGMRTAEAVSYFLRESGGRASVHEIVSALAEGGASLGRYPLRTVKISVTSPSTRHIFRVDANDMVELISGEDAESISDSSCQPSAVA
jgi:hypothetical protein